MNATVAGLTARTVLGRRRTLLLLLLPLVLLALCIFARILAAYDQDVAADLSQGLSAQLLGAFGLGVLLPLLGLIAGTGVIGPEIDDGSIVYLLAKPLKRPVIVVTKLAVAIGVTTVFGALPVFIAGMVLTGEIGFALSYAAGALAAGIAYCSLFLLLAVVTRNAVVIGLFYALIWESLVGGFVPGAQTLSVQQWGLALTERFLGSRAAGLGIDSATNLSVALPLLIVVVVGGTWYAGQRLRSLRLSEEA
ncbi:MAG TPA: ABC transporter permease subunit [Propionibacteriaceae bacterium]|nr:ABC transporter permease subunit [Propionibacteriaceae bacterium]